ncbi:MAG: 3'(2'),5'-bisphosphate nucleotidase CysQ [Gemmatimonadetes bacterium]|nr:3'(2'),5'-bisphosphate nucleotidase CysQ [Gemmatimonadota bacterium]
MPDLQSDLELALHAARAAAEVIRPAFRAEMEVRYKDPDQPVTDADVQANRVLWDVLLEARPEYGWLSEETSDSSDRLWRSRLWVVDPIDGTNSFIQGIAEFAVSIGLVEGGRAVLGVVANPATGEVYHAVHGGGAFLNGAPIHVSAAEDAPRLLCSRSELRRGEMGAFDAACTVQPLGSTAYKMVKVADGTGDAFVSFGPKHEWDVCGAEVILREAGGQVTGLDGAAFRYNQQNPSWRGVVASNGRVHSAMLARVAAGRPIR